MTLMLAQRSPGHNPARAAKRARSDRGCLAREARELCGRALFADLLTVSDLVDAPKTVEKLEDVSARQLEGLRLVDSEDDVALLNRRGVVESTTKVAGGVHDGRRDGDDDFRLGQRCSYS
jgi:hypothetical protein